MSGSPQGRLHRRIREVESQSAGRAFPVFVHAAMLGDRTRLEGFRKAIDEAVGDAVEVAEIGTGTGVLAWHAARRTRGRVVAIEVDEASARAARIMFAGSTAPNLELYQGLSLGRPVDARPEVLIAEILGPLGLEENIVELCHEFARQYPTVRRVIPAEVSVFLLPVRSHELHAHCADTEALFLSASEGGFDYRLLSRFLEDELCRVPFPYRPSDACRAGDPVRLARFRLGVDRTSAFRCSLELEAGVEYLNLYFEARLSDSSTLSTAFDAPRTHWPCYFVKRPSWASEVCVSYDPMKARLDVGWSSAGR